jgi:hypothetical protein
MTVLRQAQQDSLNNHQASLRKCFDKLSMTAPNNPQAFKIKNSVSLSLSKACFDGLSMTLHNLTIRF